MRALPDLMLMKRWGVGKGAGGRFLWACGCPRAWVPGGLGAWGVPLAVPLAGAVVLVLDGAFFERQANGVNAIAKISGRIETFAGKHVP